MPGGEKFYFKRDLNSDMNVHRMQIGPLTDSPMILFISISRRETNCFVELYTNQRFQVSPLDDKLAPVGPLEGGAKLEEGKPNLLRKKAQTIRLPI